MQLKKHISISLAVLILFSNIGLAVNVHFCKDKLAAISSVFTKSEVCEMKEESQSSCCIKKETSHKKCCSDKELNIKDSSEKLVVKKDVVSFASFFTLTTEQKVEFYNLQSVLKSQNSTYYCDANAPPLYKLYCKFTLFG